MFHNKSIERLRRMMEAIRSRDFTLQYSLDKLRGEERQLAEEINAVIAEFRDTQARQEAMYGQFETLLNQVQAALIVDDGTGRVLWMNARAINGLCGFKIEHLDMLAAVHPTLPEALQSLRPGEQRLINLPINHDHSSQHIGHSGQALTITMTQYFRQGDQLRLFSIENMQSVLQQNEVEAQRRLVSVLTHEIMNSLAPIISLSETLLDGVDGDEMTLGLNAIHRRSEGLLKFVDNYRQLSRIPSPVKQPVVIGDIIADIQRLFPSPYITYDIEDMTEVIDIDRNQMEQVLINLLKNADEAIPNKDEERIMNNESTNDQLTTRPSRLILVKTHADRPRHRFTITVEDNGCGIAPEAMDRIFVPFFSTKQGGSGIGLSICRQIVIQHGGTIRVSSQPGHTVFTVEI